MLAIRRACGLCAWLLNNMVDGGWWLWLASWGGVWCWFVVVFVCLLGVARFFFEMKRAGDLFPNHPKERTDSVRQ